MSFIDGLTSVQEHGRFFCFDLGIFFEWWCQRGARHEIGTRRCLYSAVVVHVGGREVMVRRGGGATGVEVEIGDGAARGRRGERQEREQCTATVGLPK